MLLSPVKGPGETLGLSKQRGSYQAHRPKKITQMRAGTGEEVRAGVGNVDCQESPPQVALRAAGIYRVACEVNADASYSGMCRVPRSVLEIQCHLVTPGWRLQISLWQPCCLGDQAPVLWGYAWLLSRCVYVNPSQPRPCLQRAAEMGMVPRAEQGVLERGRISLTCAQVR